MTLLFAVLPPFLGASAVCECLHATTRGLGTVLQSHSWSDSLLQHLTSVDGARCASDVSDHLMDQIITFVAPDECGSRRCICKYSYVADRQKEKKKCTEYLDHQPRLWAQERYAIHYGGVEKYSTDDYGIICAACMHMSQSRPCTIFPYRSNV